MTKFEAGFNAGIEEAQGALEVAGFQPELVLDREGIFCLRVLIADANVAERVRGIAGGAKVQILFDGTEFLPQALRRGDDVVDPGLLKKAGLDIITLCQRRERWDQLTDSERYLLGRLGLSLQFEAQIRESDYQPAFNRQFLLAIGVNVEKMIEQRQAIQYSWRDLHLSWGKLLQIGINLGAFLQAGLGLSSYRTGVDLRNLLVQSALPRAQRLGLPVCLQLRWARIIVHPGGAFHDEIEVENAHAVDFATIATNAIGLTAELRKTTTKVFLSCPPNRVQCGPEDTWLSLQAKIGMPP